jgi:hypothetical protein
MVSLPKFLSDQGIKQIMAPLPAKSGKLWADVDGYRLILYPFVAGHDAKIDPKLSSFVLVRCDCVAHCCRDIPHTVHVIAQ